MSETFVEEYIKQCDISTVSAYTLCKLPMYKGIYEIDGESMGSGCHLDPPGYPSYFVQHIYNRAGNEPKTGATAVIMGREVMGEEYDYDKYKELLHKLWVPLSIDHQRTRMWINKVYQHMNKCYHVTKKGPGHGDEADKNADLCLIYPVPDYVLVGENDIRKATIQSFAERHATEENHQAVRTIKKFYPAYEAETDLISKPKNDSIPTWWEYFATKPNPCPGHSSSSSTWRCPVGGTRCQVCGWEKESDDADQWDG